MQILKSKLYSIVAPTLRKILGKSVTGKNIKGTSLKLFYNRSQHLGFLFQKEVEYEKELSSIILNMIEPGSLVIEIGSNIGQYSLLIADKIGRSGKLVCIEPDSDNLMYLSNNIQENNLQNVETINAAVSNQEGVAVFYKDTVTGGRMGSLFRQYSSPQFRGESENVSTITLKALITKFGTPDFVKVDVEGAEDLVFSDEKIISSKTRFLIEVRKETKEHIFSFFTSLGFSIYLPEINMVRANTPMEIPDFANLIIIHE